MTTGSVPMPSITIVAPMYNVENYIGQCLDSILAQTFKDYELLVIDDCSTDRSSEIAASYLARFDGRMRLIRMEKNTGGAALPRNTGIRLSRGKYLAFIDTDDLFTPNALEDMFNAAEQSGADVVHTERYFVSSEDEIDPDADFEIKTAEPQRKFVDALTVETDDLSERINRFIKGHFFWYPWGKLFNRDLVVKNAVTFPNWPTADDTIFCFKCLCLAKKYVRIPSITNVYRTRADSLTNKTLDVPKYVHRWSRIVIEGTQIIDEFMDGFEIFVQHPELKFLAINFFVREKFNWLARAYNGKNIYAFDKLLRQEFAGSDNQALSAYLFNMFLFHRLQLAQMQRTLTVAKSSAARSQSLESAARA